MTQDGGSKHKHKSCNKLIIIHNNFFLFSVVLNILCAFQLPGFVCLCPKYSYNLSGQSTKYKNIQP